LIDLFNPESLRRVWRSGQPFCVVRKISNQSLNSGTLTDVTWDIEDTNNDLWGMHDTSTNSERINIPITGRYLIKATLDWETNATGLRRITVSEVGVLNKFLDSNIILSSGSTLSTIHQSTSIFHLSAGVYVKVQGQQNSGGALNILTNNVHSQFGVVRIG